MGGGEREILKGESVRGGEKQGGEERVQRKGEKGEKREGMEPENDQIDGDCNGD